MIQPKACNKEMILELNIVPVLTVLMKSKRKMFFKLKIIVCTMVF